MASAVVVQISITLTSSAPTRRPSSRPMNAATTHKDTAGSQSGANYFFGVLFAFAAIVLAVIACGIGSSRRSSRRRASRLRSFDPWSSPTDSKGEVKPPQFYEIDYSVIQDAGWRVMMPLSATFLNSKRQELDENTQWDEESLPGRSHSLTRTRRPVLSPSRFLSRFRPKTSESFEPMTAVPSVAIQTVILVALPFRARDQRLAYDFQCGDSHRPSTKIYPEIQIGVETFPWIVC